MPLLPPSSIPMVPNSTMMPAIRIEVFSQLPNMVVLREGYARDWAHD